MGFLDQKGYRMMYHKLIDRPWLILILELFLIYTAMYILFATVCYYASMVYNDASNALIEELYEHNAWFMCFNFAVHTGTSIGYGFLLTKEVYPVAVALLILGLVYITEIFDVLFIGVLIQKIKVCLLWRESEIETAKSSEMISANRR